MGNVEVLISKDIKAIFYLQEKYEFFFSLQKKVRSPIYKKNRLSSI